MPSVAAAVLLLLALAISAHVAPSGAARLGPQPQQQTSFLQRWWLNSEDTECETSNFRKSTLTMIKEMPFIGLFDDIKDSTKFEASGMTTADGWLWVVFDNLHALGKVDEHFEFRDEHNLLVGEAGEDSQFEGITYVKSTGRFFAIEEVFESEKHGLVPFTHELELSKDGKTYTTIQKCPVHFELTHQNKGFEGVYYHEDEHGHKYLLGLCEGNYCAGGKEGRIPGHGRVVVSEYNGKDGDDCGWDVKKVVHIPKTAEFMDYSGMAFKGDKVAIISQEDSAMWVGTFDFEELEFTSDGTLYNFPRNGDCEMIYCNVEGIQWIDDVRFVIASDKAKSKQPYRCTAKDQRISIFALPDNAGEEAVITV
eukprot:GHRR01001268.1.p1 GENE.GHRR01001268.1~~GHRR01001268.1.p1  ORF type:complete len:366 (+),score=117.53 GHRR01001268.1:185-1282(+)